MDGWTERPNHGDARNPKWSILLLLTWSFCRLGGHSIHQYASRLAAIGIQKFPELSSYGISKALTSKSFLDQKPTNIFPAMSFRYKKFSRPKTNKYLSSYGMSKAFTSKSFLDQKAANICRTGRLRYFLVQANSPSLSRSTQPSTHCEYESSE